MSYDVKCPYCKEKQEINHDDGHGYEEDRSHEQHCVECGETFLFTTSISYSYEYFCRDGDHELEPFGDPWANMYECKNCDYYQHGINNKNKGE